MPNCAVMDDLRASQPPSQPTWSAEIIGSDSPPGGRLNQSRPVTGHRRGPGRADAWVPPARATDRPMPKRAPLPRELAQPEIGWPPSHFTALGTRTQLTAEN